MAYQLSYWTYSYGPHRPDDLEEVMPPRRIKRVKELPRILRPIPRECDVVTLDRTDGQSSMSQVVWARKGGK